MKLKSTLFLQITFLAVLANAQVEAPVSNLVAQAIANNPTVAARELQVLEAELTAKSLGSTKNPQLELSPGVGFTNSNFVLEQSLDLFGSRSARATRAKAEIGIARANLRRAKLAVASESLNAYVQYRSALTIEANAVSGVENAKATVEAIKKRIEIGEAPALHLTRAEVELSRAEQALTLAKSEVLASRSTVNSLIGKPLTAELQIFALSTTVENDALVSGAVARRPETVEARSRVEIARAAEAEARKLGSPNVFAGVAADTWSLDRKPFQSSNLGLQFRFSMPLFDRGENRNSVRAAEALLKSREAEATDAERRVLLEVNVASNQLKAAREVAQSYETGIVPKAEQMLTAMRAGLASGLTSFLEVLEAQRTLFQLKRESADATRNLQLAELRFLTAVAQLPGLES